MMDMPHAPAPPSPDDLDAIRRLLDVAARGTGQSAHAASFLLAWWNAAEHGGFDLTELWAVDAEIAADMVMVFSLIARHQSFPPAIDAEFEAAFEQLAVRALQHED